VLTRPQVESLLWDDWHAVAEFDQLRRSGRFATTLLDVPLSLALDPDSGSVLARADDRPLAWVRVKYGFVWVCLGEPTRDIVEFPECGDADRLLGTAGSVRVAVSGLRAVENFLDLSHLSFVHTGFLGEEPFTEIKPYSVQSSPQGGVIATGCRVYQPKASPVAREGFDVSYTYAVLRPFIVVLYKANPVEQHRRDMIALLVQPLSAESCVAHLLTCYLTHGVDPAAVRRFQQFIFGQDRPILENQLPKRLPLTAGREIPVRADVASAAYRRWLADAGIRYGAIPAAPIPAA
jgi:phenylpropionate dioxygenase-like ring-hydroxylating dioxygenase large terminal subunit